MPHDAAPRFSSVRSCNVSRSSFTGRVPIAKRTFDTRDAVAVSTMPASCTNVILSAVSAPPRVSRAANQKMPTWDKTQDLPRTSRSMRCMSGGRHWTMSCLRCFPTMFGWRPLVQGQVVAKPAVAVGHGTALPRMLAGRGRNLWPRRHDRTGSCMTAIDACVALGQKACARCA